MMMMMIMPKTGRISDLLSLDNDAPNPGTGVTNGGTLTELSQLNITVEESSAAGYKEIRLVHKKLYVTLEL